MKVVRGVVFDLEPGDEVSCRGCGTPWTFPGGEDWALSFHRADHAESCRFARGGLQLQLLR